MGDTLTFLLILITYALSSLALAPVITMLISKYERGLNDEMVRPLEMVRILNRSRGIIIIFGSILFPLFFCFVLGFIIGDIVYNILIGNNNEDRIASWFI